MLFSQSTSLVVGGFALSAVACISWLRTGQSWFLVWTAVSLIALVGRLGLERAFRARRQAIGDLATWRARFIAGAWIMGALWGSGIANRRRFDAALAEEMRRAKREDFELALLLIDIDLFKGFNDLYGHQVGDACLQRVAAAFAAAFRRPGDLVARYGGEEFAAILARTDLQAAAGLAEIVRGDIESLALRNEASPVGFVSVSVGVASLTGSRHDEDFIRAADEALYAAKEAGRNCVRVARDDGRCRLDPVLAGGALESPTRAVERRRTAEAGTSKEARFRAARSSGIAMSEAQIAVIGKARERLETLKVRL